MKSSKVWNNPYLYHWIWPLFHLFFREKYSFYLVLKWLYDCRNIQNRDFRISTIFLLFIVFVINNPSRMESLHSFLCIYHDHKAIHDTLPSYTKKDARLFILYFGAPVLFQYDCDKKKIVKTSKQKIFYKWLKFIEGSIRISIYLSVLIPCSYRPFPTKETVHIWDYSYWGNLLNNYVLSCKFFPFTYL